MKITEFRENLSTCLDAAANGDVVTLERGGLTFYLVSSRDVDKLIKQEAANE